MKISLKNINEYEMSITYWEANKEYSATVVPLKFSSDKVSEVISGTCNWLTKEMEENLGLSKKKANLF